MNDLLLNIRAAMTALTIFASLVGFAAGSSSAAGTGYVIRANADWIPLENRKLVLPGSALDLSKVLPHETVRGCLTVKDGHFVSSVEPERPLRFWGGNISFDMTVPSDEDRVRVLDMLERAGHNSIRIHHYELPLLKKSTDRLTPDPEAMDRFDRLFAEGKRRGFRFTTDLFVGRKIAWRDIGVDRDGNVGQSLVKGYFLVHEPAFANWCAWAKVFLTHVNPHTGLSYADDPAMSLIALVNEGWFAWRGGEILNEEPCRKAYQTWLAEKRAKDPKAYPSAPADCKGFSMADHRVPGFDAMVDFMGDREVRFATRARDYLRSIGVKALLTDWNCGWCYPDIAQVSTNILDYADEHFYTDHPSFEKSWQLPATYGNSSPDAFGAPKMRGLIAKRGNCPMVLSEWNVAAPGACRGAGGFLMAACAARGDWDALWRFTYADWSPDLKDGAKRVDFFSIVNDPFQLADDRVATLIFRRRECAVLPLDERGDPRIPVQKGTGRFTLSTALTAGGYDLAGSTFRAGDFFEASLQDANATLWASSLDNRPFTKSGRLLVTHLTDLQADGTKYADETRRKILAWGSSACVVRRGTARVALTLEHPERYLVWGLGTDGRREYAVPTEVVDGRLIFVCSVKGPDGRAHFLYEVAKSGSPAMTGGGEVGFPSPVACVRACPDGAASAKRLWNGISPQVKEWELGKRAETLRWFEENQFGKTPCGRLPDEVIGASSVSFTNAGLRIEISCRLPEGADAAHPAPVFLFGDHRGGNKAPDYPQETYEGIPTNSITARGYAYVRWNFNDICPNVSRGASLDRWPIGILSYLATGERTATNVVRAANGWGTIGAWAWGNSRVMDWIESRPELDAKRVAVLGHSRGGKTALWTGAQDERFAMTISNGSGCGGARLGRTKDLKAETIKQILHNFPNWFCPAFSAWIDRDAELPHDADDLIRLIAPRLVYVASGSEDAWAGPAAEKAAWESAHDLYRAYGLEERMGYHCHDGIHKLRPDDWEKFMDFADHHLKAPSAADSDAIACRIAAACTDGSRTVTLSRNAASADGAWHLTRAIVLPDDFTLVFDGCRVELVDGTQDNLVRNAGAVEGACRPNRGIRILGRNGAVLSGGRRNHYLPQRSGDPNGWRSVGILLCDVSDYEVGGFAMEETQCWAISQERCCRGRVHDIVFGSTDIMFNQDGVDVRKGCHDLVIENISGSTGDDAVALTASRDPIGSPVRYGMQIGGCSDLGERDDVYNVTIRNVKARSAGGHGVIRLLACDGIRMHHVSVENVIDTATGDQKRPLATIRIGDTMFHKTRRCEMGEMHHVSVRNVTASGKVAVWIKGPLRDSEVVSITAAPSGRKYDITAPVENVSLDE